MFDTAYMIRQKEVWLNECTHLFRHSPGIEGKLYCPNVVIEHIKWYTDETGYKTCSYCGQEYSGFRCEGCNGRVPEKKMLLGKAEVMFEGMLPGASWLLDIREGTIFEVLYKDIGRRDQYEPEQVIMTIRDCEVIHKSIPTPVTMNPDQSAPMTATTTVKCTVELWLESEENE